MIGVMSVKITMIFMVRAVRIRLGNSGTLFRGPQTDRRLLPGSKSCFLACQLLLRSV